MSASRAQTYLNDLRKAWERDKNPQCVDNIFRFFYNHEQIEKENFTATKRSNSSDLDTFIPEEDSSHSGKKRKFR